MDLQIINVADVFVMLVLTLFFASQTESKLKIKRREENTNKTPPSIRYR